MSSSGGDSWLVWVWDIGSVLAEVWQKIFWQQEGERLSPEAAHENAW